MNLIKNFFIKGWQFFASVIVVFFVFISQFHDLKSPTVAIEITAVKSTSSQPIDLINFPELSALRSIIARDEYAIYDKTESAYSPDQIDRILLVSKNKVADLSLQIENAERKLNAEILGTDHYTVLENLSDLNQDLFPSLRRAIFLGSTPPAAQPESESTEQKIQYLTTQIKLKLEDKRKERDSAKSVYKEASRQWDEFKSGAMPNRTKLVVTCAIGNQGSGATSLKPQALFRANLGDGNYLDFPMKMSDYYNSSEAATLVPQSYKVVKFESDEIQSMTSADRERFKLFLGNASPARIFVSDVRGDVYASNSVPFSPGVYEQKMFDSLKQFASSNEPH